MMMRIGSLLQFSGQGTALSSEATNLRPLLQQNQQQQHSPSAPKESPNKRPRHHLVDFAIAASATSCACVLSNPIVCCCSTLHTYDDARLYHLYRASNDILRAIARLKRRWNDEMEVVKTRMQLQGELVFRKKLSTVAAAAAKTAGVGPQDYRPPYRNALHAFYKICRDEGFRGIQAGLIPGLMYQILMNGTRLSLFGRVQKVLGVDREHNSETSFFLRNLVAGAACGSIGGLVGSPAFLVKARLQSQSTVHNLRTPGAGEFRYRGMWHAVTDIIKKEGLLGMTRGMQASVLRVTVGSSSQLASYSSCKAAVLRTGLFEDNIYAYLASSMVAGLVVTTAMNPFDVITTRLYAQGTGVKERYTGPLDCAVKTVRAEGIRGLYKGWTAHYFRLGPHTIFTFLFWEEFKKVAGRFGL